MDILVLIILFLPLLGFLLLGPGFRTIPRAMASIIGPGTVGLSFLLTVILFFVTPSPCYLVTCFNWLSAGTLSIPFALLIDPLSILMMLIVTGVGFLIHVYSVGYMKDDPGFNRFFSYMNLFVFSMLLLVMGASYPVMFMGWEGVGLCSYLLIGFWYSNHDYSNAAKKAFIMNRIGDLGFLLGMFLIFTTFGSLDYITVFSFAGTFSPGDPAIVAITLLLFVGAIGKSAQIPLFTWLPDAMAGPTPVSALIHAATMVTAGIYMVARSGSLYMLAPATLAVVAGIGLATALFAATVALFQNDIKKVLAYSTISQLGYMFLALGAGAFTGAMFHLTTHAFFKALLFLGAGSVIHAMGGEQDIRKMGGLSGKLSKTHVTFLAATLAIAGIPPLSGFFSKDEILLRAFSMNLWIWIFAVAGSLLTAFYMFRLYFLIFRGRFRGTPSQMEPLHESPGAMTLPMVILAILALFGGILNIPETLGGTTLLRNFLAPVFEGAESIAVQHHHPSQAAEWILMGITLAGVLLSAGYAYTWFVKKEKGVSADDVPVNPVIRLLSKKYYIDEVYDYLFVRPALWFSGVLHGFFEIRVLDRFVNGIGNLAVRAGSVLRYVQTGNAGFYMFIMILGVILILLFNILI